MGIEVGGGIVIGGGIIQDIGAFTAKIFKRGINWIYFPTTWTRSFTWSRSA